MLSVSARACRPGCLLGCPHETCTHPLFAQPFARSLCHWVRHGDHEGAVCAVPLWLHADQGRLEHQDHVRQNIIREEAQVASTEAHTVSTAYKAHAMQGRPSPDSALN